MNPSFFLGFSYFVLIYFIFYFKFFDSNTNPKENRNVNGVPPTEALDTVCIRFLFFRGGEGERMRRSVRGENERELLCLFSFTGRQLLSGYPM